MMYYIVNKSYCKVIVCSGNATCENTVVSTKTKAQVEAIARCGNKFRHYFRCAKTTNEKRHNAIPEYKRFIRGKRRVSHISPAWDDYFVHTEKNWKRLKVGKQYMKNTKRRMIL